MTDRELLHLAATAAGISFYDVDSVGVATNAGYKWNPLTDDGDALRLAVKKRVFQDHYAMFIQYFNEEIARDKKPSEATRRAIVRAAAEIGKVEQ